MPNLKTAYAKLKPQGFEIIGLSLDSDRVALAKFLAKTAPAWPQYFEGEGRPNKYAEELGVNHLPTRWLIDKRGNLRDLNAREDLIRKVERLLAEK